MKGAVLESPGKIVVKEIPDPVIDDYDVLCNTLAASVCSGTDGDIVNNHPYHNVKFPTILGHEGIGRVIECGSKVRYFKKGDMITRIRNKLSHDSGYHLLHGAFAEKSIATDWQAMQEDGIDEGMWRPYVIHRVLPDKYDPVPSTMLITWRETYAFFKKMEPQDKDTVLVIGSGATALSFTNHATNLGLRAAVIGNTNRREVFSRVGACLLVSYLEGDHKCLLNRAGINIIDSIIDAVGNSKALTGVIGILKNKGKIGVYGLNSFQNYHIDFTKSPGIFSLYNGEHYDEGSAHDEIISYIESGKLNAWNYISKDHIYPLEKINDALDACSLRKTMKSVIKFD